MQRRGLSREASHGPMTFGLSGFVMACNSYLMVILIGVEPREKKVVRHSDRALLLVGVIGALLREYAQVPGRWTIVMFIGD